MNDMTPAEPTIGDVLTVIREVNYTVGRLQTEMNLRFGHVDFEITQIRTDSKISRLDMTQLRGEVSRLRAEVAAREALWKHETEPGLHKVRETAPLAMEVQ